LTISRLILREILFRKLSFAIGVLAVASAVASLVATRELLDDHDRVTDAALARKEGEAERRLATQASTLAGALARKEAALAAELAREEAASAERLRAKETELRAILAKHQSELAALTLKHEDETRNTMKDLGFNILILPKDQNLGDLYSDDFASKYMPESYVDRLANSNIVTVNHLLPSLTQKILWPERSRTVILIGVRGEVPILHRDPKKPILDPVPKGRVVLGHELATSLEIATGDEIALLGREFRVETCYEARGNKDDITIWIDLATAQELMKKEGEINAILALECVCTADRLPLIRSEIAAILPETQVIERGTQATVRAEARAQAKRLAEATLSAVERDTALALDREREHIEQTTAAAEAHVESVLAKEQAHVAKTLATERENGDRALAAERASRGELHAQRESFAAAFAPLVLLGSAVLIATLAFLNVRERRSEIGILRAIGVSGGKVLRVFVVKAAILGFAGAAIGVPIGHAVAAACAESRDAAATLDLASARDALFDPSLLVWSLVLAPLVAIVASWVPALVASRQDPAEVLRDA